MGGGVWQDNFDGTYTQLDDDYYVPATGYSYLDLYLMGLISAAEVPDFFILRNLTPAGKDANGHPIFKADRTKVTIQDVYRQRGTALTGYRPLPTEVQHRDGRRCRAWPKAKPRTHRANQRHPPAVDRLLGDNHWTPRVHDSKSTMISCV